MKFSFILLWLELVGCVHTPFIHRLWLYVWLCWNSPKSMLFASNAYWWKYNVFDIVQYAMYKVQFCHIKLCQTRGTKSKCINGVYIKMINCRMQDRLNKMSINRSLSEVTLLVNYWHSNTISDWLMSCSANYDTASKVFPKTWDSSYNWFNVQ